jgi:hypothetical protein
VADCSKYRQAAGAFRTSQITKAAKPEIAKESKSENAERLITTAERLIKRTKQTKKAAKAKDALVWTNITPRARTFYRLKAQTPNGCYQVSRSWQSIGTGLYVSDVDKAKAICDPAFFRIG